MQNRDKKIIESLTMAGLAASSDRYYQQAIAHFNDALSYSNQQKNALIWAGLQISLANSHQRFAAQTSGKAITKHFAHASNTYQQALQVYTRQQLPQGWAATQNNHTREQLPQQWAGTQNNLANTLKEQGIRTGGKQGQQLLVEAVTAYGLALQVRTRQQLPQQWGETQNNLANVLQEQGIRIEGKAGKELLITAIKHYRFPVFLLREKDLLIRKSLQLCQQIKTHLQLMFLQAR